MKKIHKEKIISILEYIKSHSDFIGGGSGEAERREFRDVNTIWELGLAIKKGLDDSNIPEEHRGDMVRKIVIKFDYEIIGKQNDWSSYAYEWVTNFQDKDYFLKVCKFAGYRDDKKKNRFRKGDLRYLIPIFSKIRKSSFDNVRKTKLDKELSNDSILDLGAHQFQELITKRGGKQQIPWGNIRIILEDLQMRVTSITHKLDESVQDRNKFREEVGKTLLSQISAALQLCVLTNEDDFNYGYDLAKKQEFNKKAKSQNEEYLNLLENLKKLLRDYKIKNKLLEKSDYYEYEQLASNLDALKNEDDFKDFFNRKKNIAEVFG